METQINSDAYQYFDIGLTAYSNAGGEGDSTVHRKNYLIQRDAISADGSQAASHSTASEEIPVVLIHAFPIDRRMWNACAVRMLDQLGDTRILAFEMPGAGQTPIPDAQDTGALADDGAYSEALDRLAESYVAVLHKLGYSKAIWVGISMGGYVALAVHRLFSQAVAGLALCDTRSECDTASARANRLRIAEGCEHGAGVQPVMHFVEIGPHDSAIKKSQEFISLFTGWIRDQDPRGIAWRQRMAAGRKDETPYLHDISVPATVITGELDPSSPPEVMQQVADGIPGAQLHVIADAGHFSCVEQPEQVAQQLVEFIQHTASNM